MKRFHTHRPGFLFVLLIITTLTLVFWGKADAEYRYDFQFGALEYNQTTYPEFGFSMTSPKLIGPDFDGWTNSPYISLVPFPAPVQLNNSTYPFVGILSTGWGAHNAPYNTPQTLDSLELAIITGQSSSTYGNQVTLDSLRANITFPEGTYGPGYYYQSDYPDNEGFGRAFYDPSITPWPWTIQYTSGSVTITDLSAPIAPFVTSMAVFSLPGITGSNSISFDGTNFVIGVDIGLIGDPLAPDVRQTWEQGIEGVWSNQFYLSDGLGQYPILVDVEFLDQTQGTDYTLRVTNAFGQSYVDQISEWFTQPKTDLSGQPRLDMLDEVAAHEFGHMLGLYDESDQGHVDPSANPDDLCRPVMILGVPVTMTGAFCNSMMADYGPVQERYFDEIKAFLENTTGHNFVYGPSPLLNTYPLTDPGPEFIGILETHAAAEPSTLSLIVMSLLAIGLYRRFAHRQQRLMGLAGVRREIQK